MRQRPEQYWASLRPANGLPLREQDGFLQTGFVDFDIML